MLGDMTVDGKAGISMIPSFPSAFLSGRSDVSGKGGKNIPDQTSIRKINGGTSSERQIRFT